MSAVVIVDLFHSHCLQYNVCLQKRVKTAATFIGERKYERVYFMLQTHDQNNTSSPRDTTRAQLQELTQMNEITCVLEHGSVAASLYYFKQAVDELDQSAVLVLTSTRRIAELKAYQERLFTALYTFEYAAVFDECPSNAAEAPTDAQVEEQVAIFVRQLPVLKGEISVLRSSLISDCFSHGFTTRTGGVSCIPSLSALNLFCSSRRRDPKAVVAENLRRLGLHAGFDPEKFHLIKTDHASDVWVMGKPPPSSYDGIVTNRAGVVIAAPGADCMPLLFTDPVAKVIGVAHAGWKGTLMGIAMATVSAMVTEFGSKVTDIVAVIGPSVGPCCFSLDKESAEQFHSIDPSCVRGRGSAKPHIDIRLATRILLQQGGLLPHHIQDDRVSDRPNLTLCTACHPEQFFSHVRDGNHFGTQIGFLWIKEPNNSPL
ncbi:LOW QUALITY PROTEIN: purine nucleoside phosphorylase LACC1 [Anguilla anguilla]|uniref:LOW QUALITY PROTEIN: purine nucleoside phosphorylase LACC1 n=1 Tax=Anguilla anguilla TaxID=7936 RepID=UPI0015B0358C|nr:LOW QUALITY PROTEIN: purine nucleoside phosphorylase LACC1 [Anguilla anguilla]